ncbi:MAG TPA: hypothetical protein VGC72_04320 [Candidatus Elarobacter sp.]
MKRDAHTRSLIIRGYLNLALYFGTVVVLLLPTLIYPGARGIRIALIVCGVGGVALVIGERLLRHRWTWLFGGGCLAWSIASIAIAFLLPRSDAAGIAMMQLLIVFSLALLFIGLPWIVERRRTHKT